MCGPKPGLAVGVARTRPDRAFSGLRGHSKPIFLVETHELKPVPGCNPGTGLWYSERAMDRQSEQDLIHAALAGSRSAAEGLVQAHQASLYAFMLRRCGRPEVAEDVVQEAFVRALTNLHRFDTRFRFSTWLFTIAKRLHCNAVQKCAPMFDSDLVAFSAGDMSEVEHGLDAHEERSRTRSDLDEALGRLPEMQRDIVVLFHQCDWPIARIAEHFLMPSGTVKSHLHRGRRKLRVALEAVRADRAALRSAQSQSQSEHPESTQRVDRGVDR